MRRNLRLAVALLVILFLSACSMADQSLGKTVAKVTFPDGTVYEWNNTKNIDLEITRDSVNIKSVTPEQAMANVAASNAAVAAALSKIAEMLIPAAARAGALSGS